MGSTLITRLNSDNPRGRTNRVDQSSGWHASPNMRVHSTTYLDSRYSGSFPDILVSTRCWFRLSQSCPCPPVWQHIGRFLLLNSWCRTLTTAKNCESTPSPKRTKMSGENSSFSQDGFRRPLTRHRSEQDISRSMRSRGWYKPKSLKHRNSANFCHQTLI